MDIQVEVRMIGLSKDERKRVALAAHGAKVYPSINHALNALEYFWAHAFDGNFDQGYDLITDFIKNSLDATVLGFFCPTHNIYDLRIGKLYSTDNYQYGFSCADHAISNDESVTFLDSI